MTKGNQPLVCIIIVNWNGGQVTMNCLKSLKKTSYKNYKVILVDNGSTDNSVKQLKEINKKMEVIYLDKNYGYTIGTNTGWKYALKKYNADYICAMDSDIVTIQKDWLDVQIKEMEKNEKYGLSGGKLIFPDGRVQRANNENETGHFEKDHRQFDFIKKVPSIRGGCIIIKKSVINKIGEYDENFFYGPNDIDYCYRARKKGFEIIYNGFSKSIHLSGYSGLSHEKDWIFLPQTEGMLIFYMRSKGLIGGILISTRFLLRAFITRKDPYTPIKFKNLIFHKSYLKRMFLFFRALSNALKNYKKIKQNSKVGILKIQ